MPKIVADENVTYATVDALNRKGISTKHVERDYGMEGKSDPQQLAFAAKKKATLLSADRHFSRGSSEIKDTDIKGTYGVIKLDSIKVEEQVEMVSAVFTEAGFKTTKSRKDTRIEVKKTFIASENVRTNEKRTVTYKIKRQE